MAKIRKPSIFDKKRLKKEISFSNKEDINLYFPTAWFCNLFSDLIPLKFKTNPETFVLEEDKKVLGSVTVFFHKGNPFKINIGRLFFEQDYMEVGKQLIDYIVSKYGAKGAKNFLIKIEDNQTELLNLFTNECGFRQCLSEEIFKIDLKDFKQNCESFFRPFKNSDAQTVADIYNDLLITHFKPSLSKLKREFIEAFFVGLQANYTMKFVMEDKHTDTIKAYLKITSPDNKNFLLDITKNNWYDCNFDDIIVFTKNQIARRTKDFNLFVRVKKYKTNSQEWEDYFRNKGFEMIENKIVLVKDFYKLIKNTQETSEKKILIFNESNSKPVFKI